MKIKLFVAQFSELGIFLFNSYFNYLTRGFIASVRAFNLLTCAFNLPICAFNLPTCTFYLVTRAFTCLTRGFEFVTREFKLVTCGFELVTRVLLFHTTSVLIPQLILPNLLFYDFNSMIHIFIRNEQSESFACSHISFPTYSSFKLIYCI